jgi:hypothetical protein
MVSDTEYLLRLVINPGSCARTASGHAAAMPLRTVMNSRRLIRLPHRRKKLNHSGSRDAPGSNLRCNCSASERVSTIVWNAAATFCEMLSGALGIGFLTRAFLADLDFLGATALRLVFAIALFLLELLAFFVVETVLLRVFFAIVDPQCRCEIVVRA